MLQLQFSLGLCSELTLSLAHTLSAMAHVARVTLAPGHAATRAERRARALAGVVARPNAARRRAVRRARQRYM